MSSVDLTFRCLRWARAAAPLAGHLNVKFCSPLRPCPGSTPRSPTPVTTGRSGTSGEPTEPSSTPSSWRTESPPCLPRATVFRSVPGFSRWERWKQPPCRFRLSTTRRKSNVGSRRSTRMKSLPSLGIDSPCSSNAPGESIRRAMNPSRQRPSCPQPLRAPVSAVQRCSDPFLMVNRSRSFTSETVLLGRITSSPSAGPSSGPRPWVTWSACSRMPSPTTGRASPT